MVLAAAAVVVAVVGVIGVGVWSRGAGVGVVSNLVRKEGRKEGRKEVVEVED